MHTIVELESFSKEAKKLLTSQEIDSIINFLSSRPKSGEVIQGTGGVRKLRWALESRSKGKSGGVRVIYYYCNNSIPLFLVAVFDKSVKINLSKEEKNQLALLTNKLKKSR